MPTEINTGDLILSFPWSQMSALHNWNYTSLNQTHPRLSHKYQLSYCKWWVKSPPRRMQVWGTHLQWTRTSDTAKTSRTALDGCQRTMCLASTTKVSGDPMPVNDYTNRVVARSASLGFVFHRNSVRHTGNTCSVTSTPIRLLPVLWDILETHCIILYILTYLLSFVILGSLQDFFFKFQLPYKPLKAPINININVLIMHTSLHCRITYFYDSSALYKVQ